MIRALDYVNVMTYDLAAVKTSVSQHHSPLNLSITNVEHYVSKGVPKEKVLMGVPFYGHSYKLADKSKHGEGAPVVGDRDAVKVDAIYKTICDLVKKKGWHKEHGYKEQDPIAYFGDQWISYDDPYSLNE